MIFVIRSHFTLNVILTWLNKKALLFHHYLFLSLIVSEIWLN